MRAHERIIREQFAQRSCGQCGVPYEPESVVILAHRGPASIVLVTCGACQRQSIFRVSFPLSHATTPAPDAPSVLNAPASLPPSLRELPLASDARSDSITDPISSDDVNAMHAFLRTFGGDFQAFFAHHRRTPSEDASES